jgi:hypothetical protein
VLRLAVKADPSTAPLRDPERSRAFDPHGWKPYTDTFRHLGWSEHRFELEALRYGLSPVGRRLQEEEGGVLEDLLNRAGAVDEMRAALRKVFVTEQDAGRSSA